jgi:hypothetical protein
VNRSTSQGSFSFCDRARLVKIKLRAIRAGIWYRALRRIDRVIVDLTINVAHSVRSVSLASCILSVTRKLEGLLESRVDRAVREVGFPLARKLSAVAQGLGNVGAWAWASDGCFARYLAVVRLNG